jgi:diaminopimelate decarboxylase
MLDMDQNAQSLDVQGDEQSRFSPEKISALETPCYLFDPAIVVARHARLRSALGTPLVVSVKANPNIDLYVRCGHAFTDGVELASIGELNLVVGRAAVPKFVTTPALDKDLLSAAIASRAMVVLDNPQQVELLLAFLNEYKKPVRVGLRINAASMIGPTASAAQTDHFGFDIPALFAARDRLLAAGAGLAGLHVYAGSYKFKDSAMALVAQAGPLLSRFEEALSEPLEFFNLGGGFGEDWSEDDHFVAYRRQLADLQQRITVMHEAGRAIYHDAGAFITRVLAVKQLDGRLVAVCDGGIAQAFLLAQTEKMMKTRRAPLLVRNGAASPQAVTAAAPVQLVGNSCNRNDVIGELPAGTVVQPGDMLVFDRCGAYHTYSPTGFLNLRPPSRYLVS